MLRKRRGADIARREKQALFGVFHRTKQPDSVWEPPLTAIIDSFSAACFVLRLTRAYSYYCASYRSRTGQLCRSRLILARSIRSARPADGSACLLQYPLPGFSSTPMISAQRSVLIFQHTSDPRSDRATRRPEEEWTGKDRTFLIFGCVLFSPISFQSLLLLKVIDQLSRSMMVSLAQTYRAAPSSHFHIRSCRFLPFASTSPPPHFTFLSPLSMYLSSKGR